MVKHLLFHVFSVCATCGKFFVFQEKAVVRSVRVRVMLSGAPFRYCCTFLVVAMFFCVIAILLLTFSVLIGHFPEQPSFIEKYVQCSTCVKPGWVTPYLLFASVSALSSRCHGQHCFKWGLN
jgi:hypothetical protein